MPLLLLRLRGILEQGRLSPNEKMCTPISYDDVSWEKSDDVFEVWKHNLYRNDVLQAIGKFVQKHRGGVAIKLCNPLRDSFNVCIQVDFLEGGSAMTQIPCPGVIMFSEEKGKREAAAMRHVLRTLRFLCHLSSTTE